MANPIGNLGMIPSLSLGNNNQLGQRLFTDTNIIALQAATNSNVYSGFRKLNLMSAAASGTTNIYTPSGSKTFVCWMMYFQNISASAFEPTLGYGDTAIAFDAAAEPTTPIYNGGMKGIGAMRYNFTALTITPMPLPGIVIPNGKYPFLYVDTAGSGTRVMLWGYEV